MTEITHRFIDTNGIHMRIAEAGQGPLVVLLHGWPESWYSWRHQLTALAEAGYHVVAPDQRGYGQSDRPTEIEQYTQLHLVGDVLGILDAFGEEQAALVGHDWGANVAWNVALMRPDRIRGVVGLSVPYMPRGAASFLAMMRGMLGERFYMAYFQQPGVAEAELERDVRTTFRKLLYSNSGDAPADKLSPVWIVPEGKGFLDLFLYPETLPGWLSQQDLDYYTSEFERTGFGGTLNWYRTFEKSWELMAPWTGAPLLTPALYMVGEQDTFVRSPGGQEMIAALPAFMPALKETIMLPGCGHYIPQERPEEVNAALLAFLQDLTPQG